MFFFRLAFLFQGTNILDLRLDALGLNGV